MTSALPVSNKMRLSEVIRAPRSVYLTITALRLPAALWFMSTLDPDDGGVAQSASRAAVVARSKTNLLFIKTTLRIERVTKTGWRN